MKPSSGNLPPPLPLRRRCYPACKPAFLALRSCDGVVLNLALDVSPGLRRDRQRPSHGRVRAPQPELL